MNKRRCNKKRTSTQDEESILDILTQLFGSLSRTATAMLSVLLVLIFVGLAIWIIKGTHATVSNKDEDLLSHTEIESIKAIGQWEFLSIRDEELVDTTRRGLFSTDQLVRIYTGTLRLGIDMADVKDGWIEAHGDTVSVILPQVKLIDEDFLDEAAAKPFFETGKWSQKAREALAEKARRKMLQRCLTPSNIESAEQNATARFEQLFQSMGFNAITIRFEEGGRRKNEK